MTKLTLQASSIDLSRLFPILVSVLCILLSTPTHAAERMDPDTLDSMPPAEFEAWARRSIGSYETTLLQVAQRHKLPPRLLATIILNELGDYGIADQGQEYFFSRGSVGIAQITIPTAIENKLVDLSEDEIRARMRQFAAGSDALVNSLDGGFAPPNPTSWSDPEDFRQEAIDHLVWEKLNQPKIAIEAAARQIVWLISRANANLDKSWPTKFLKGPIDLGDPYANIITDRPWQRDPKLHLRDQERMMATLITGGYNSANLMWTDVDLSNLGYYPQARKHADNATNLIAEPLFELGWYEGATTDIGTPVAGAQPLNPNAAGSLVLLLDASGSMKHKMGDGRSRLDNVKAAALQQLQQMDGRLEIALIVFYDCARIVVEVPFTLDPVPLRNKLSGDAIKPSGSTPLAAAIETAKNYLRDFGGSTTRRVVVLTDGNETCGGDLVDAIRL